MTVLSVAVAGRGLVDPSEPVFYAGDEALLRGRAAFETTRVYGGLPFMLDAHLDRLRASSVRLGLLEPDVEECRRLAEQAIAAASPDVALRLYWTGTALVAITSTIDPRHDAMRERGIALRVERWSTGELAGTKSTSYAENMRAMDAAIASGADDALLVADDGTVLECPTANVWWRKVDRLYTPSLALPILAGVTRVVVVELWGQGVTEGVFPLADLLAADEAFVSASNREIMPVVSVDGQAIGDGKPGRAARALQNALRLRATATL
ncbi:MAG TPA: aminotransferase class IV [Gaiellaceae bacterium]|nr:aminotransferase class IV [Gaiellaceae bacterium]